MHAVLTSYALCIMQIPLGVITKNEQKMEEMIEIMEQLQSYIPRYKEGSQMQIFFAGDQLTCERIRGAKRARKQPDDTSQRFSAFVENPGDWHALVAFYQVC